MNRSINRVAAVVVAFVLAIGGVSLASIPANAAPANPAALNPVGTFEGSPTAASMNGSTRAFHLQNFGNGTAIHAVLSLAHAATPSTFATFTDYGPQNVGSNGAITLGVNSIFGTGTFTTGDILRFTVDYGTSSTYTYNYTIPATGSVTSLAPTVTVLNEPYTGASIASSGAIISVTNLDTQKPLLIETSVSKLNGGVFDTPVVIERNYYTPSSFSAGTLNTTLLAYDNLDTSVNLDTGDAVMFTAFSGASPSNSGSDATFLVAPSATPVPAGAFDPAAPTAAEFLAGVDYNLTNLDNTVSNILETWIAPASAPTTFVKVGSDITIAAGDITAGNATKSLSLFYAGTPNTALHGGDIVQVRLAVNSAPATALTTYPVPTPPFVPGTPAGAFDPATPTAAELLTGVDYNLTDLDSTKTNVVETWVAPASAPTTFAKVGTDLSILAGDIVAGESGITVALFYSGTPNTPLNAGDIIQIRLAVNGAAGAALTTYVVPGVPFTPGTPAGSYTPADPTAAKFVTGADFTVTNLDATKTNVIKVYIKDGSSTTSTFVLTGTLNVAAADINNGNYVAVIQAYLSPDNGVTKTALPNGSIVRVTLTAGTAAEVSLSDYTIGSATPGGGASQLANTGSADDRQLQTTLITVVAIAGVLGLGVLALILIRRRKAQHS